MRATYLACVNSFSPNMETFSFLLLRILQLVLAKVRFSPMVVCQKINEELNYKIHSFITWIINYISYVVLFTNIPVHQ